MRQWVPCAEKCKISLNGYFLDNGEKTCYNSKAINLETEWLYAPDYSYAQRAGAALCMQLIFPYRSDMPQQERYPLVLFVPGAAWYRQEMYNSVPQWAKLAEQVRSSKEAKFPTQATAALGAGAERRWKPWRSSFWLILRAMQRFPFDIHRIIAYNRWDDNTKEEHEHVF